MAELDEEKVKFEIDGHPLDGYIPSPPDDRDYTLETVCALDDEELPEEYITDKEVPVLNQGANSDCVAHAIAVAIAHGQYKAEGKFNDFSRGYIYGNRKLTDAQGEGMIVRQALKNCNHDGDCLNIVFPYRGTYPKMKAKIAEKPEEYAREAAKSKIVNYCRLYSEREIKKAIMRQGAVVIGTTLFEGFGTHVKVPTKDSKKTGGHAMCCVGWNKEGWIIQNSWGCYDDQTEVLTAKGFKLFKDCTENDLFATLNPANDQLEYHQADRLFSYPYTGDLFHYKNSKIDLAVTPNHNMYIKTLQKPYFFEQAQNITQKNIAFKRTARWEGIDEEWFYLPSIKQQRNETRTDTLPPLRIKTEDFLTFIGYYVSEGSCSISKCLRGGKEYNVIISQSKKTNRSKMWEVLSRLPFNFHATSKGFSTANQQLWAYVSTFGYSHEKHIPEELLKFSPKYLIFLFEGLMLGDGSSILGENGHWKNTYYTSSPKLRDQFQELCLKLGFASNVYEDKYKLGEKRGGGINNYVNYQIRIQRYKTRENMGKDFHLRTYPTKEPYQGTVYCAEVPNHTLFVRRMGKTCWCGNSLWGDHGYCYMPYEYPADEWWGITVSTTIPQPEKDSFLKRLINFFKYIIINLRNFFHKKNK